MPSIEQQFGFEDAELRTNDISFHPLRDTTSRWVTAVDQQRESGELFWILYELRDGRFAFVVYENCTLRKRGYLFWKQDVWIGERPPQVRLFQPYEAAGFLRRCRFEIPASLADRQFPPKPEPRPLSHWAGKNPLVRRHRAPPVDLLAYFRSLIDLAVPSVQVLREWTETTNDNDFIVRCFNAQLQEEFLVDLETWKGPQDEIPPRVVSILDLVWPPRSHPLREIIQRLRLAFDAPMAVLTVAYPLGSDDFPTPEELTLARRTLIETLPQIEADVVGFKKLLSELEKKREEEIEKKKLGETVPMPTEDERLIWSIRQETGEKQSEVAKEFTKRTGKQMSQGQVSKALASVERWRAAGNTDPPVESPDPRKAISVDPSVLDRGQRQDNRTPSQRGKVDPE